MTIGEGGLSPTTRRAMLGLALASVAASARAQTAESAYPNRPVRIIIPSAPGGPTDVMARMISPALTATFGQPVIILNRPGAGGNIGVV
jgi:tripartite-type tricarboxylate transporter receptor subunit TctC